MAKKVRVPVFLNEHALLGGFPGVKAILALDEVGRGCLAGPVLTGASLWVVATPALQRVVDPHDLQKFWVSLVDDSKKMTPRAREICFDTVAQSFSALRTHDCVQHVESAYGVPVSFARDLVLPRGKTHSFAVMDGSEAAFANPPRFLCAGVAIGAANVDEIDSLNIWKAIQLAMGRALRRLCRDLPPELAPFLRESLVLMDGNSAVRLPREFALQPQVCAIGADAGFVSVGLSSVVAKVMRDRYMVVKADEFPGYGLEKHKGYATAEHAAAIRQLLPTSFHRRSFLKSFASDAGVETQP